MNPARSDLIRFCTNYEVNQVIVGQILEHGINYVMRQSQLLKRTNRFIRNQYPNSIRNVRTVTYLDPDWPKALFDLDDEMPLVLWYQTQLRNLMQLSPSLSITGTTQLSLSDAKLLGRLIFQQSSLQHTITSAGTLGAGVLASQLANSNAQPHILVLASGITDRSWSNTISIRPSFNAIVVSELPTGVRFSRERLLKRNRIVAALGSSLVAVRPHRNSTALNTMYWATQLGRDVLVI